MRTPLAVATVALLVLLLVAPTRGNAADCPSAYKSGQYIYVTLCGGTRVKVSVPEAARPVPTSLPTSVVTKLVKVPPKIIRVPRATKTVYRTREIVKNRNIYVPGPTKTVRPSVVKTETVLVPQPPETKFVYKTIRPNQQMHRSRQHHSMYGKMGHTGNGRQGFFSPSVDFGDHRVTAAEAGLGLLAMTGLAMLGLLLMYFGYYIGYKSSERQDTNFMRDLRDQLSMRSR